MLSFLSAMMAKCFDSTPNHTRSLAIRKLTQQRGTNETSTCEKAAIFERTEFSEFHSQVHLRFRVHSHIIRKEREKEKRGRYDVIPMTLTLTEKNRGCRRQITAVDFGYNLDNIRRKDG